MKNYLFLAVRTTAQRVALAKSTALTLRALLVATLVGTSPLAAGKEKGDTHSLSVRWLETCDGASSTLFEVKVFSSGLVEYRGGDASKTQGTASKSINLEIARRLISLGDRAARAKVPNKYRDASTDRYERFCIEVRTDGSRASTRRLLNDSRIAKPLLLEIGEKIAPEGWLCPLRPTARAEDDGVRTWLHCRNEPNELAYLGISAADCGVDETVALYVDGTVYHVVSVAKLGEKAYYPLVEYQTLAADDVVAFKKLVGGLELVPSETGLSDDVGTKKYLVGYGEAVAAVRVWLGDHANLKWTPAAEVSRECESSRIRSRVLVPKNFAP